MRTTLSVIAITAVLAAGCGSGDGDTTPAVTAPAAADTTQPAAVTALPATTYSPPEDIPDLPDEPAVTEPAEEPEPEWWPEDYADEVCWDVVEATPGLASVEYQRDVCRSALICCYPDDLINALESWKNPPPLTEPEPEPEPVDAEPEPTVTLPTEDPEPTQTTEPEPPTTTADPDQPEGLPEGWPDEPPDIEDTDAPESDTVYDLGGLVVLSEILPTSDPEPPYTFNPKIERWCVYGLPPLPWQPGDRIRSAVTFPLGTWVDNYTVLGVVARESTWPRLFFASYSVTTKIYDVEGNLMETRGPAEDTAQLVQISDGLYARSAGSSPVGEQLNCGDASG